MTPTVDVTKESENSHRKSPRIEVMERGVVGVNSAEDTCVEGSRTKKARMAVEFHVPAALLAKIVSLVAVDGPEAVKNWILAGNEGKAAVFSKETLSKIRLDINPQFVRMSKPHSSYFKLYSKCLERRNPYALFVESLRLGFCVGDLLGAIDISKRIKDEFPLASLLHIMLCCCSGDEDLETFQKFQEEHKNFTAVEKMGEELITHIMNVEPRRADSYGSTWKFDFYPDCWEYHEWFGDYSGERCSHCIYFYISRDVRLLS